MSHVEISVRLSQADYASLCAQAEETCRTVDGMVAFLVREWGKGGGTFNPIKSPDDTTPHTTNTFGTDSDAPKTKGIVLKKRKNKIIPDDADQRVIMDGVRLKDPYNEQGVVVNQCKVFFYENKTGTAILPSVMARFKDVDTGERVESISFATPEGVVSQDKYPMKVLNQEELVQRWLAGEYEVVDNPMDYEPVMVRVRDGKMVYQMGEIPVGEFVPSPEQLAEYRSRGWKQRQIEAFIKMRSGVVPMGTNFGEWLADAYASIDAMA